MEIIAKIVTSDRGKYFLEVNDNKSGNLSYNLWTDPSRATIFPSVKKAEAAVAAANHYWGTHYKAIFYEGEDSSGILCPIEPETKNVDKGTKETHDMKTIVRISFPDENGRGGYLRVLNGDVITGFDIEPRPDYATRFDTWQDAEKAVARFKKGKTMTIHASYFPARGDGVTPPNKEETIKEQDETPPPPKNSVWEPKLTPDPMTPDQAILEMYKNRIGEVEQAMEILGRKIKANDFSDINAAYAAAAMSLAAVADFTTFFESVITELHKIKAKQTIRAENE